jgi:hypothetical protein
MPSAARVVVGIIAIAGCLGCPTPTPSGATVPEAGPPPAAPVAAPSVAPAPAPAAAAAAAADPIATACAEVRDQHFRRLDGVERTAANPDGIPSDRIARVPRSFGRCARTRRGAWVVTLDTIDMMGCHGMCLSVTYSLRHLGPQGREDGVLALTGEGAITMVLRLDELVLVDAGGDEELVAVSTHRTDDDDRDGATETATVDEGALYRYTGTEIIADPRAAAYNLVEVRAADPRSPGAGPTLFTDTPYGGTSRRRCTSGGACSQLGFDSVALRADVAGGAFVLSWPSAVDDCRRRPRSIVALAGGRPDLRRTSRNLVCARMRGVAAAEVVAALRAQARRVPAVDLDRLIAWANAEPPLQLH